LGLFVRLTVAVGEHQKILGNFSVSRLIISESKPGCRKLVKRLYGNHEDNLKIRTLGGSLVGRTRIKLIVVVHLVEVRHSKVV
jgi:hypothetical protein